MTAQPPQEPSRDPADVLFTCSLEDLNCLHDYMMAAMAGDDLSELPRLWNQQIGVIRSRPIQQAGNIAEEGIDFLEKHCRFDSETELFQASEILKEARSDSQSKDETISALISENARIGSELKRMTERAEMLSGEHDSTIAAKAREEVLDELGRQCIGRTKSKILDIMADFQYHPEKYLESLRSEVKKQ